MSSEPLLEENKNRFVLFPLKYPDFWEEFYKCSVASFWTSEEVDLTQDLNDWNKLSDNERHFIKYVLAFFASSDGIVNENLCVNFYNEIQVPEIRSYYTVQMMIETCHSEVYSQLIDTYVKNEDEKNHLFNAIHTIPIIQRKADWCFKYFNRESASFAERICAFCIVEGLFFSASFCSIYWLKKRGLMPGLSFANELISRDESLHTRAAAKIHSLLQSENKATQEKVHQMIRDAVEIEKVFVSESLPVSLIGMNVKLMQQYVEFIADYISQLLGFEKIYNVSCPFDFMDQLSLSGSLKTNFFESRNSSYSKAFVGASKDEMTFKLDADF